MQINTKIKTFYTNQYYTCHFNNINKTILHLIAFFYYDAQF